MQRAGEAVKTAREAQGLSQRQLADMAGVSHAYLSRVERLDREPTQRWLDSITAALGRNLALGQPGQPYTQETS